MLPAADVHPPVGIVEAKQVGDRWCDVNIAGRQRIHEAHLKVRVQPAISVLCTSIGENEPCMPRLFAELLNVVPILLETDCVSSKFMLAITSGLRADTFCSLACDALNVPGMEPYCLSTKMRAVLLARLQKRDQLLDDGGVVAGHEVHFRTRRA